jgi:hypothetical protein
MCGTSPVARVKATDLTELADFSLAEDDIVGSFVRQCKQYCLNRLEFSNDHANDLGGKCEEALLLGHWDLGSQ